MKLVSAKENSKTKNDHLIVPFSFQMPIHAALLCSPHRLYVAGRCLRPKYQQALAVQKNIN